LKEFEARRIKGW